MFKQTPEFAPLALPAAMSSLPDFPPLGRGLRVHEASIGKNKLELEYLRLMPKNPSLPGGGRNSGTLDFDVDLWLTQQLFLRPRSRGKSLAVCSLLREHLQSPTIDQINSMLSHFDKHRRPNFSSPDLLSSMSDICKSWADKLTHRREIFSIDPKQRPLLQEGASITSPFLSISLYPVFLLLDYNITNCFHLSTF